MSQNVRLEEMTDVTVSVRHVEEGHVYSYYLAEDEDGRRILSSSPNVRDGNGGHAASLFERDAWRFAEQQAKAGKID